MEELVTSHVVRLLCVKRTHETGKSAAEVDLNSLVRSHSCFSGKSHSRSRKSTHPSSTALKSSNLGKRKFSVFNCFDLQQ